jgi:two-component system response regulator NreC
MAAEGISALRLVVADDHPVVRRGLRLLLESHGHRVVAETGDIPGTVEAVRERRPDILLLDLNLPGGSLPDLLDAIAAMGVPSRTLVLTMDDRPATVRATMAAGAHGYACKDVVEEELLTAIAQVHAGHHYVSPALGAALAARPAGRLRELSEDDRDLLRLVALGYTAREIAELLGAPQRRVEWRRTRVQQALGAATRADLVRIAIEEELVGR